MMIDRINRRQFVGQSMALGTGLGVWPALAARIQAAEPAQKPRAAADAVIFIWLPGGVAQNDTWDVKRHTPFEAGMKGSQLLGTCPSIPTSVPGLRFGEGLDEIASVMKHGALVRSLTSETKFGAVHLKAQYAMLTGYLFPVGVKAPSLGAVVGRTLGPAPGQCAALHLHWPRRRHERHREAVH